MQLAVWGRIFLWSTGTGVLVRLTEFAVMWFLVRCGSSLEPNILQWFFVMRLFISVVLFGAVGMMLQHKKWDRQTILWGVLPLMGYGLAVALLETVMGSSGMIVVLRIPMAIFDWGRDLAELFGVSPRRAFLAGILPLGWMLFGRKQTQSEQQKR